MTIISWPQLSNKRSEPDGTARDSEDRFSIEMSDPDYKQDFSARGGCVWAPGLVLALVAVIAALVLIARHRTPFRTGPHVTPAIPYSAGDHARRAGLTSS